MHGGDDAGLRGAKYAELWSQDTFVSRAWSPRSIHVQLLGLGVQQSSLPRVFLLRRLGLQGSNCPLPCTLQLAHALRREGAELAAELAAGCLPCQPRTHRHEARATSTAPGGSNPVNLSQTLPLAQSAARRQPTGRKKIPVNTTAVHL